MWFREGNNDYANDLYHKIKVAYGKNVAKESSLITLNVWANLTPLDDILKRNGKDLKGEDLDTERRLFNAYLSVNEVYGQKSDHLPKEIVKTGEGPKALLE